MAPLLQIVNALYPQSTGQVEQFTWEVARALGGYVLSLTSQPGPAPAAWEGLKVLTPAAGESESSAWHRALDTAQPGAVFVQHLGALSPSFLMDLRERGVPYAVFLHDFTPLCPTRRLWHRSEEPCSGPGRTGWKCAWCVSGAMRRAAELPLRMVLYRHRPQDWRTALIRADALVASSRFARDFWIEQGAPPERIAVIAPRLEFERSPAASGLPVDLPAHPRRLLFAGGVGHAGGAELLGGALDQLALPVRLEVVGVHAAEEQMRLRAGIAERHETVFHDAVSSAQLPALLAACPVVVVPPRWQQPYSRLLAGAQAAGARAVASAVGGLAEQIIHGVNGFLAAPDDAQALAEALLEAFDPPQPAWAGPVVAAQAHASAQGAGESLRRLLELLPSGATEPDPTLELEHGAWLVRQAARGRYTPLEGAQKLVLALRQDPDAEADYAVRAFSTTRRRLMELNHAVAFFRGCGCRRIASVGDDPSATPDVVEQFGRWGLELVGAAEMPDGLWLEAEQVNSRVLRLRFPQAKALVASLPEGIETQDWTADEDLSER
ncbi:MAG: glycosyltransferase [Terriglobales bacterium]